MTAYPHSADVPVYYDLDEFAEIMLHLGKELFDDSDSNLTAATVNVAELTCATGLDPVHCCLLERDDVRVLRDELRLAQSRIVAGRGVWFAGSISVPVIVGLLERNARARGPWLIAPSIQDRMGLFDQCRTVWDLACAALGLDYDPGGRKREIFDLCATAVLRALLLPEPDFSAAETLDCSGLDEGSLQGMAREVGRIHGEDRYSLKVLQGNRPGVHLTDDRALGRPVTAWEFVARQVAGRPGADIERRPEQDEEELTRALDKR